MSEGEERQGLARHVRVEDLYRLRDAIGRELEGGAYPTLEEHRKALRVLVLRAFDRALAEVPSVTPHGRVLAEPWVGERVVSEKRFLALAERVERLEGKRR